MSDSRATIGLIVGSARPVRVGRQLADEIAPLVSDATGVDVRILDLREIALPMLDEPVMAALADYRNPHTLEWAEAISATDGLIFLTPQYNFGYPASLKNAIDYLFAEWRGRPSAIVSYGRHGGGNSAKQLHEVLGFVRADLIDAQPQMKLAADGYAADGHLGDPAAVVAQYTDELREVARQLAEKITVTAAERAATASDVAVG